MLVFFLHLPKSHSVNERLYFVKFSARVRSSPIKSLYLFIMKNFFNITRLQNALLATLKSIFNMDKQAMSMVTIKVEKQKSPFHFLDKK